MSGCSATAHRRPLASASSGPTASRTGRPAPRSAGRSAASLTSTRTARSTWSCRRAARLNRQRRHRDDPADGRLWMPRRPRELTVQMRAMDRHGGARLVLGRFARPPSYRRPDRGDGRGRPGRGPGGGRQLRQSLRIEQCRRRHPRRGADHRQAARRLRRIVISWSSARRCGVRSMGTCSSSGSNSWSEPQYTGFDDTPNRHDFPANYTMAAEAVRQGARRDLRPPHVRRPAVPVREGAGEAQRRGAGAADRRRARRGPRGRPDVVQQRRGPLGRAVVSAAQLRAEALGVRRNRRAARSLDRAARRGSGLREDGRSADDAELARRVEGRPDASSRTAPSRRSRSTARAWRDAWTPGGGQRPRRRDGGELCPVRARSK